MAGFMKVLFRNLIQGPSTDPFPLGETFTPKRVRGRVVIDPDLCVGCGVCKHSCTSGAIDITRKEDQSGYTITVWRNSCCLCASCRHYCPTGAITVNNDWHSAHPESEKYECIEQHTIDYVPCLHCGTLIRPLPEKLAKKLYAGKPEVEAERVRLLCPRCRQLEDARRNEDLGPISEKPEAIANASSGAGVEIDLKQQEVEKEKAAASAPVEGQADNKSA